ncbi:hypothetical protein EG327_001637 [Venturia inaequalis]|uniref:Aminoglycoside phosphotransferase domain-containing protein n=1 Tax=Venturia inaequalis TaxID=5025 RepID=A0A8H3VJF9_VENIN|nr:hypothetical protein EG327_001637 [Venturia inaequalis]
MGRHAIILYWLQHLWIGKAAPQAEPFETFQHKVIALCNSLWPGYEVMLEDLAGGGYNRIIGITTTTEGSLESDNRSDASPSDPLSRLLKKTKRWLTGLKRIVRQTVPKLQYAPPVVKENTVQYILRVPHQTDLVDLQHQTALFEFANRLSKSWDVPTAKYLENTSNNPLGVPFVVQSRIPGMNLDQLWDSLNQQQRISLGGEIGKVFFDISKHSVIAPGIIDPTSITEKSGTKIRVFEHGYEKVVKIDGGHQKLMFNEHVPATRRWSVLDVLRSRFENWKAVNSHTLYPDIEPYTKLTQIAEEIESSWSPDHRFFLSHNDFYPRNIMAWVQSDSQVRITGVVDWDLVDIAPAVVAFQPPWWVWKYDQYWDEIHDSTPVVRGPEHYEAVTVEEKQIRAAFEKSADGIGRQRGRRGKEDQAISRGGSDKLRINCSDDLMDSGNYFNDTALKVLHSDLSKKRGRRDMWTIWRCLRELVGDGFEAPEIEILALKTTKW